MSRSATPIAIRTCAMRRRSTTVSGWRTFPSTRTAAKTCSSSAASTRTRGQPRRLRRHVERVGGWSWPGIVQNQNYHNEHVAPALDNRSVVYRGPVGGTARTKVLGSARALLHLINFDEPFGLSVVEALACGTPVVASNRGSMPELIDPGVTGFLVDSVDAAVDAIGRIGEIDRTACRSAVSTRFTVDRMADRYLYDRSLAEVLPGFHWPSFRRSATAWSTQGANAD
jgi:Glycosyl transferases group 1